MDIEVEEIKLIKLLKKKGFNDKQIKKIKSVLNNICRICWDGDSACKCWLEEKMTKEDERLIAIKQDLESLIERKVSIVFETENFCLNLEGVLKTDGESYDYFLDGCNQNTNLGFNFQSVSSVGYPNIIYLES